MAKRYHKQLQQFFSQASSLGAHYIQELKDGDDVIGAIAVYQNRPEIMGLWRPNQSPVWFGKLVPKDPSIQSPIQP